MSKLKEFQVAMIGHDSLPSLNNMLTNKACPYCRCGPMTYQQVIQTDN